MKKDVNIVKDFYNEDPLYEWRRLNERHPHEFILTTHMMDKYIHSGDSILDIGSGPGKYAFYYAQKGCKVTMVDLAPNHISFALNKSKELGLSIEALQGDALIIDEIISKTYDHIFLMGPLYHLLEASDRIKAIEKALSLLKPGGYIYISFIMMIAGLIYYMQTDMSLILEEDESVFLDDLKENRSFSGDAFTKAHFFQIDEIDALMQLFSLEKKHLFGQESILGPCEDKFLRLDEAAQKKWYDIAMSLLEKKDLLSYSNHLMYIGKKI